MIIRSPQELEVLRQGGKRLGGILKAVAAAVKPGLPTSALDDLAEGLIRLSGGAPVFKGYAPRDARRPFPASLCVSVNDEVVHAIPRRDKILQEGDIVSLDIGMRWPAKNQNLDEGLVTDTALTLAVGTVPVKTKNLLRVTEEALQKGIAMLKPGVRLGDLGYVIQRTIERHGFSAVRELVGHGVGRVLQEKPYVPNFGQPGDGEEIREGMVLAIEPMATLGRPEVVLDDDGWTFRTRDKSLAAHFEHTVVVTKYGAEILTKHQ